MTRRCLAALLGVATFVCSSNSAAAQRRDGLTLTQWREDLAPLASQLERKHASLYQSVARVSAEDAYRRVSALLSRDNDEEFKHSGPAHLTSPEVLAGLGLADSADGVTLTLTLLDGSKRTVAAAALRTADMPPLISMHLLAGSGPPLYASQPGKSYWYRFLSDSRTLYVQINAIANQQGQPSLADFVADVFRAADRDVPARLILDLRNNSGGNNRLNRSIVAAFEQRQRLRQPGVLYVITGRRTFSAAMDLILDLQRIAANHCRRTIARSALSWRQSRVVRPAALTARGRLFGAPRHRAVQHRHWARAAGYARSAADHRRVAGRCRPGAYFRPAGPALAGVLLEVCDDASKPSFRIIT